MPTRGPPSRLGGSAMRTTRGLVPPRLVLPFSPSTASSTCPHFSYTTMAAPRERPSGVVINTQFCGREVEQQRKGCVCRQQQERLHVVREERMHGVGT